MRFDVPEKMLQEISSIMDVQLNDPSSKTDPYMRGLANGMIMVDSVIRGIEPKFIEKPALLRVQKCEDGYWLHAQHGSSHAMIRLSTEGIGGGIVQEVLDAISEKPNAENK